MSNLSMENQQKNSYLFGGNAGYIETLYEQYLNNPQTVSPSWRKYFEDLLSGGQDISHARIRDYFLQLAKADKPSTASGISAEAIKATVVAELIQAYRKDGHYAAQTDPLKLATPINRSDLALSFYDLTPSDLEHQFSIPDFYAGQKMSLKAILQTLKTVYSSSIGIEYLYIADAQERLWIQNQFEQTQPQTFSTAEKKRILQKLTAAEGLEKYLGSKYVGQKRFSLEGGEVLIPMLDQLIQQSGDRYPVKEIAIGMAHRGRLNVLLNIVGKPSRALFDAFEGKLNPRSNDVKYHLGAAINIPTAKGSIHVTLAYNPSHLEIVNPVVEGSVRARQECRKDEKGSEVVPVLIHGDASFAGQGVVMETLALSQTHGYYTGGTIHIVLNNQVGFTTNPVDSRSSFYCTDIAKMIDAPVFHVNGDDPEAVLLVTQVALDYRMAFNKDVVIDLICFRRHGHNEADEPAATQPLMYQVIKAHPGIRKLYAEQLIQQKIMDAAEADALVDAYRDALDTGKELVSRYTEKSHAVSAWQPYLDQSWRQPTANLSMDALKKLCQSLEKFPKELVLQPQVARVMDERRNMLRGEHPLNWGCAEALAFARLLSEGYPVRLSGQDSQRGTFAHRHAVLHNYQTGETYTPLAHISKDQAPLTVIDSILSEEAVLGYEYGFASTDPQTLVVWEAQYGDFANGAQVVVDQFISSGEQKWGRLCGLVMFLPHGYEGSGPEHSSARLERYLQLCAEDNMQVCIPTTPAQIFHLICRQMIRPYRKPLIVMTPKSILRHKLVISSLTDLTQGEFQLVIPDQDNPPSKKIKRIVLCSGKIYYDLLERQRTKERQDVAIIRIEQLYPFPTDELATLLASYTHTTEVVWCQEEPKNQGAWYTTQHRIQACLAKNQTLSYAGRLASASPAVAYMSMHLEQQNTLLDEAFF